MKGCVVLVLAGVVAVLSACKGKAPQGSSGAGSATATGPSAPCNPDFEDCRDAMTSAAPVAASATPPPALGRPAGDVLRGHPELLIPLPSDWASRVAAFASGDTGQKACPALADVKTTDEFERRDAVSKALASCKPDNERAIGYLKACPVRGSFPVMVNAYDFGRSAFPIVGMSASGEGAYGFHRARVGVRDKLGFDDRFVLAWPGVLPWGEAADFNRKFIPSSAQQMVDPCQGATNDVVPVLARFHVDLKLPEADAKKLRDQLTLNSSADTIIEIAYLLDSNSATETLPCHMEVKSMATGRVLAWRLAVSATPPVPLSDWFTVSNWEPPASCTDARAFFGVADAGTDQAADDCVCRFVPRWKKANDWIPAKTVALFSDDSDAKCEEWAGYDDMSDSYLQRMRDKFAKGGDELEKLAAELQGVPGCKAEGTARKKMLATLDEIRRARQMWSTVLLKASPTLADMNRANGPTCGLVARLRRSMSDSCDGATCAFGCPGH